MNKLNFQGEKFVIKFTINDFDHDIERLRFFKSQNSLLVVMRLSHGLIDKTFYVEVRKMVGHKIYLHKHILKSHDWRQFLG